MKQTLQITLALALAAAPSFAGAADTTEAKSTPADQKSMSVTIYNDNLGLVKDVRSLELKNGVQNLWFEGVAGQIDATSVHIRSVDAPNALRVLEQNFEYDLISPDKLMEKYIGQTVELVVTREDGATETTKAKLIGTQGGYVYELENGKIAVNPPGRVVLPALPSGLISKPSLVWMLESSKAKQTVEASYLTAGIGWKADYVAVLSGDDSQLDLSGWVTINNTSGATYTDASLQLVAGNVNRVLPPMRPGLVNAMEATPMAGKQQFQEESFFEYHLYTLERRTTLKDNQTKQIELLSAKDARTKKAFVVSPQSYWFYRFEDVEKPKVGVYISVDNTKANQMGMPLPKGTLRVYKQDSKGALQFIGEDSIDHTPEDETIRVKLGDAFDVVAERKQTNFEVLSSGHLYRSSYQVTLRNHKSENITVSVVDMLPGDWTITASSHKYEKETAQRIRFDVPVPAKGNADLTYTVEVRR
ncbi:MAG TPA: DUF4139 domain-containing protein [Candidatus Krumholzibacteria bacterium]|nr:DUF4139 domain-containing protein [Candidatus Krumholzibacteria bacterium]